jgi:hypothetical protein
VSCHQWIQSTIFFSALRGSAYIYPIVLSTHMIAIAFFGGMILLVDVRLPAGPSTNTPYRKWWTNSARSSGSASCCLLMAGCKAEEYYYNAFFGIKMTLLVLVGVHALIFRRSVYRNAEALDAAPRIPARAKLAASLSLILWTSLVIAGRGIGYIEPPLDKIHARFFAAPAIASTAVPATRWF